MAQHLQKEEREHWMLFQAGDRDSFAWLYETYVNKLYNYGFKFCTDSELIEDTIQDLFIRIWHKKEGLKIPPSVKNYLFAAFRHLLFRKLSQLKKISTNGIIEEKYSFLWELPVETSFIEKENEEINYKQLQKTIEHLTPRQKEALFLRFYENASYEEIAQIMEITVKATYKIMARAIQNLKKNWLVINCLPFILFIL